jgi:hypothetical protein
MTLPAKEPACRGRTPAGVETYLSPVPGLLVDAGQADQGQAWGGAGGQRLGVWPDRPLPVPGGLSSGGPARARRLASGFR